MDADLRHHLLERQHSESFYHTCSEKQKFYSGENILGQVSGVIFSFSIQEIFDRTHITDIFTNEVYINKVQVVSFEYQSQS